MRTVVRWENFPKDKFSFAKHHYACHSAQNLMVWNFQSHIPCDSEIHDVVKFVKAIESEIKTRDQPLLSPMSATPKQENENDEWEEVIAPPSVEEIEEMEMKQKKREERKKQKQENENKEKSLAYVVSRCFLVLCSDLYHLKYPLVPRKIIAAMILFNGKLFLQFE